MNNDIIIISQVHCNFVHFFWPFWTGKVKTGKQEEKDMQQRAAGQA